MKTVLILFLTAMLTACKVDVITTFDSINEFQVSINDQGSFIKEYTIVKGSKKHIALRQLLINNQEGWSQTLATYVPGVLVTSNGLSLNFLNAGIIANYSGGQFSKPIKIAEYGFLKQ